MSILLKRPWKRGGSERRHASAPGGRQDVLAEHTSLSRELNNLSVDSVKAEDTHHDIDTTEDLARTPKLQKVKTIGNAGWKSKPKIWTKLHENIQTTENLGK